MSNIMSNDSSNELGPAVLHNRRLGVGEYTVAVSLMPSSGLNALVMKLAEVRIP
jgi:hypothetical protein